MGGGAGGWPPVSVPTVWGPRGPVDMWTGGHGLSYGAAHGWLWMSWGGIGMYLIGAVDTFPFELAQRAACGTRNADPRPRNPKTKAPRLRVVQGGGGGDCGFLTAEQASAPAALAMAVREWQTSPFFRR